MRRVRSAIPRTEPIAMPAIAPELRVEEVLVEEEEVGLVLDIEDEGAGDCEGGVVVEAMVEDEASKVVVVGFVEVRASAMHCGGLCHAEPGNGAPALAHTQAVTRMAAEVLATSGFVVANHILCGSNAYCRGLQPHRLFRSLVSGY
jgi:hypothetical protein